MILCRGIAGVFLSLVLVSSAYASELNCLVVALSDGDTFTCLDFAKQQHKIRLANIDTPEKNQPYGAKAKQVLSALIFNKHVLIETQGFDRYGRAIGLVHEDGINVNREMVARGAAWVYPKYNQDLSLPNIEREARAANIGLWALDQIVPPWEWRALGKSIHSESSKQKGRSAPDYMAHTARSPSDICVKRLCSQMTDCADAKFHLDQCGVTSLDRNRDGVPCESICK